MVGAQVSVHLSKPPDAYMGLPAHQLGIVQHLPIPVVIGLDDDDWSAPDSSGPDLIIDALIGYSLKGAPRGIAADLIQAANNSQAPILSLDAPSGLDTTSGTVYDPAIRAAATLTLALPKIGLQAGRDNVGDLYLADIGVPPELYAGPGLNFDVGPIFAQDDIIPVAW